MTLLQTAACDQFVLSMADRQSSVVRANRFIPINDRFNKHVLFTLIDDRNIKFTGAATFTGVAQWKNKSGVVVTTDQVIADTLSVVAKKKQTPVFALLAIAAALADECSFLQRTTVGNFPGFTVVIGGFLNAIREPFLALITDQQPKPNWDEDNSQAELPAPPPFRIHFAVRCRPTVFVGGYSSAVSPGFVERLEQIVSVPGVRAYDVARLMFRETDDASKRSHSIGSRSSAILLPANGLLDTAIWQNKDDRLRAPIPRMVFPNGQQFDPSEVDLEFDTLLIGELPHHGLLFEGMVDRRVRRRLFRRLKRSKSPFKATTTFGLLAYALYGKDPSSISWEDPYSGPRWSMPPLGQSDSQTARN